MMTVAQTLAIRRADEARTEAITQRIAARHAAIADAIEAELLSRRAVRRRATAAG